MDPKDYLIKATNNQSEDVCYIGLIESPIDAFILGDSFMRGFYIIHSDADSMVGIVPHAGSVKEVPEFAMHPPELHIDAYGFMDLTS